ncbi:hypothetical protein IWQ62_003370 [Dispira parvispora]|uniref:Sphingomyelin synthase-like domain-containing protein n=1 Tax=Dispira parvispora TaxID=1520584 RepID=A0A9W8E745_9FUNG|nr:hypothetical protein IWQ62_003370 [Dispira parvispora]
MGNSDNVLSWLNGASRRLCHHFQRAPRQVNRWELFRMGAAGGYLLSVAYFMVFMQIFSDRRWDRSAPKLQDLSFDYFPHLPNYHIADNLVLSSLLFVVVGNLVLITNWRHRVIFVRRLLWLLGTLYLFRAVTLIVTTAPSPLECVPPTAESTWAMLKLGVELVATVSRTCSDNIYSGHTVILVSSFLMWRVHSQYPLLIAYSFVHMTCGILMIVFSHLHYTIDVLIAIFFTYAMFSLYFYGLERAALYHHGLLPYAQDAWSDPGARPCVWKTPVRTADSYTMDMSPMTMVNDTSPELHSRQSKLSLSSNPGAFDEKGNTVSEVADVDFDTGEWQRLMFTPRVLNNGIPRLIGWMDGLDLRIAHPSHSDHDFSTEDTDSVLGSSAYVPLRGVSSRA